MINQTLFNDEIRNEFEDISSALFNFKYTFELLLNYIQDETDTSINVQCLILILKNYFEDTKQKYNDLKEKLGVL